MQVIESYWCHICILSVAIVLPSDTSLAETGPQYKILATPVKIVTSPLRSFFSRLFCFNGVAWNVSVVLCCRNYEYS